MTNPCQPPLLLPRMALAAALLAPVPLSAQEAVAPTRVVVLGVSHSAQLVSRGQQPAAIRAFLDRVEPAAIGVERDPEAFARGDHYEFTYEIQDVVVPYARERGIPLYPFDWVPPVADQRLALGIDLEAPPEVRPRRGFGAFLSFPDSAELHRSLFFADDPEDPAVREAGAFAETPSPRASADYARRLFLYRTWLQARRILHMARAHPGQTVAVVVGYFHKADIEAILAGEPGVQVVRPSAFGAPGREEVAAQQETVDLHAIAYANLLGVQSETGVMDREWVEEVLATLEDDPSPELELYRIRHRVLTGEMGPRQAHEAYLALAKGTPDDLRFPWSGVKDSTRVDSFLDPFGNLGVRARATLEAAREAHAGRADAIPALRPAIEGSLSPRQRRQFEAYWDEFLAPRR